METFVGSIILGGSSYDDKIWGWLNTYRRCFNLDETFDGDFQSFDYLNAIGMFILLGCDVSRYDDYPGGDAQAKLDGVPDDARCSINITYNGTIEELVSKMRAFLPKDIGE